MATETEEMKVTALAPWFGCNRVLAERSGRELGRLKWCGVPFSGGAPELQYIDTKAGIASDLHRHIINLAKVVSSESLCAQLVDRLSVRLFHPDALAAAQRRCIKRVDKGGGLFGLSAPSGDESSPDVEWAEDYFVSCWMGRGGHAGKKTEFSQGLAVRWTSSGGDSAKRFQSMIGSLKAWQRSLAVWSFELMDVFAFLDRVKDQAGHGLFIDAPWPDAGLEYLHPFTDTHQIRLRDRLLEFKNLRIVVRYGEHPFIRELYSADRWRFVCQVSPTQQNTVCNEILIINGPSLVPA